MALGTRFIKSDFGIKVGTQPVKGTYNAPTKILCLEKDKAELPNVEYATGTCKPMDDIEYDYITDTENPKVTLSLDLAFPVQASLGGVEDLMLACGVIKTDVTGDFHYSSGYDLGTNMVSFEVTTKRRVYKIKDAQGTFEVIGEPDEMVRIKFSMTGTLDGTPVELTAVDPDNTIPVNYLSVNDVLWNKKKCGLLVGGNQIWAKNFSLDYGRQIADEPSFCGIIVQDNGMKTEFKTLLKMTEQNEAPISDLATGAEYTILAPAYTNTGLQKFEIQVPKGKVSTPDNETDNNGYWDVERTFSAMKTTGDDNFTIVVKA